MKKLMIVTSTLLIGMSVIGCSTQPSPTDVVQGFVNAVQTGNLTDAQKYEENPDKTAQPLNTAAKDVLKHDKFEVGKATISGNSATVDVKITAPDMSQIVKQMLGNALADAFSGKTADSSDSAMSQELEKELNSSSLQMVNSDVSLDLVKSDSGWKVNSDNKDFFSAATGHLDQLASAFNGN